MEDDTSSARTSAGGPAPRPRPRFRLGAVVAVAAAAGIIVWLAVGRSSSKSPTTTTVTTSTAPTVAATVDPTLLSEQALAQYSASIGQPIYWAGPIKGDSYELTRTAEDRIYVRYLPAGVKAGDPRSAFLIVATYPYANAYAVLKQTAGKSAYTIPYGGVASSSPTYPRSVHLAYPSSNFQVEVYDPSGKRARAVAESGKVQPVS